MSTAFNRDRAASETLNHTRFIFTMEIEVVKAHTRKQLSLTRPVASASRRLVRSTR